MNNNWIDYLDFLPEIKSPLKKSDFKSKMTWTLIILGLYFLLSVIPLYGLDNNYVSQFESLSILLAAKLGSLISLGIGPLVSGGIILQLLSGAEVINIDKTTKQGKRRYQLLQKGVNVLFIILMNSMYVLSGAIPPAQSSFLNIFILIIQLIFGGLLLMLFDEISTEYGFGSGISMFIAAGISQTLFVSILSPLKGTNDYFIGRIPLIGQLLIQGQPNQIFWPLFNLIMTIVIFMLIVFAQGIKVNIPLTMGRVRGYNIKWPIKFFYTSNIPVIFTASLAAMIQMFGMFLSNAGFPILGQFNGQTAVNGFASYLVFPTLKKIIEQGVTNFIPNLIIYPLFMIIGSILFSMLWVKIGGQDASSVAEQIHETGLSIPGFRRDKRILERVLSRYIDPLTILGAATVGLIAVFANFFSTLVNGTGLLLTVMILYQIYEQIVRTGLDGASPTIKKLLSGVV